MFDFDTPVDRKDSDSIKWGKYKGRDILPMWVADMDFPAPPEVLAALHRRIDHGVFGYGGPGLEFTEILVGHLLETYGWSIKPEWFIWLPGLVSGLNVACRSMGEPGAGVLTTVPIYPPFLSAPGFGQRRLQTTAMVQTETGWQIDLQDMKKAMDDQTALFLLCNPHNPTGRVFTRQELETLAEVCLESGVVICSDEIHCDLVLEPGCRHIPTACLGPEVAERTITLMAPSKTYNIPGLGCSFAVVSNPGLRQRFKHAMAGIVPHMNVLGYVAAQAAYAHGKPWLKELLMYLRANRDLVFEAVHRIPGLTMGPVEATYLAWIDTRESGMENPADIFEAAGVGLSDGAEFGAPGFVRLNFGCSRRLLSEALARMAAALGKGSA